LPVLVKSKLCKQLAFLVERSRDFNRSEKTGIWREMRNLCEGAHGR